MLLRAGPRLLSPGPASSTSLRLVGGGSRCDGRVEILQRGTWGRVLDAQWDMQEASVVCRQLQCGEAESAYNPAKAERGTGAVGLRGVRCAGHEAGLSLCNTSLPESVLAAGIAEDVGVVCRGEWRCRGPPGSGLPGHQPLRAAGLSSRCREPAGPAGERARALRRQSGDLLPGQLGDCLRRWLGPA